MFGIFSRKKRAEDAGRELANALILTMPFNQGQVENVLMAMRSPLPRGDRRLSHIPFGLFAFAICPMLDQPWVLRLCAGASQELKARIPDCFPSAIDMTGNTGESLLSASLAFKSAIMSGSTPNGGAVVGFLDLIEPGLGQKHAYEGDTALDDHLARILQRPVSAAMELLRSYQIN
jgi:hypothetical protein